MKPLTYGMHKNGIQIRIIKRLRDHGPMTAHELWLRFFADDIPRDWLGSSITKLRRPNNKSGRARLYIAAWDRSDLGGSSTFRLRPLYGVGNKPDAEKPPLLPSNYSKTVRRQAVKAVLQAARQVPASVFNLGSSM